MGDIADDMIDGTTCSLCGQFFVHKDDHSKLFTHGYPVACKECYEPDCGYNKQNTDAVIL